ncbi:MAG: HIT family protein [Chloroflexota bacterium]|nr:HIT family protein [Chloroflexota bacterium]
MDGCFTCEVNAGHREAPGGTIYEDAHWLADHGTPPLMRGYIVLKPKRHVADFGDLHPAESAAFGTAMQRLLSAIRAALNPERVYVCAFGETVRHAHFHLLPRYADMPRLGPSLVEALFAERWRCTTEEAEEAAGRVRAELAAEQQARARRGPDVTL